MTIVRLDSHKDQAGAWDVIEHARGELAFNVGANIGQAARVLARNFTRVVALEPCAESFEILAEEMPDNVTPLNVAASSYTGQVRLTESARSITTGQLTTGRGLAWGAPVGTRMVDCVTLDDLIGEYGAPDFVNVDTEGHEVEVLEGWSQRPRPTTLIEVHRAEHDFKVRQLFGEPLRELRHAESVGAHTRANHWWVTNA